MVGFYFWHLKFHVAVLGRRNQDPRLWRTIPSGFDFMVVLELGLVFATTRFFWVGSNPKSKAPTRLLHHVSRPTAPMATSVCILWRAFKERTRNFVTIFDC